MYELLCTVSYYVTSSSLSTLQLEISYCVALVSESINY